MELRLMMIWKIKIWKMKGAIVVLYELRLAAGCKERMMYSGTHWALYWSTYRRKYLKNGSVGASSPKGDSRRSFKGTRSCAKRFRLSRFYASWECWAHWQDKAWLKLSGARFASETVSSSLIKQKKVTALFSRSHHLKIFVSKKGTKLTSMIMSTTIRAIKTTNWDRSPNQTILLSNTIKSTWKIAVHPIRSIENQCINHSINNKYRWWP